MMSIDTTQALVEIGRALDAPRARDPAELALIDQVLLDHPDRIEQLRTALTTRAVSFANHVAGSDGKLWRAAMVVLVGELHATASLMAGSLASVLGETFSPGEVAAGAYMTATSQRHWWAKPSAEVLVAVIDRWSSSIAMAVRGRSDGEVRAVSAGGVLEATLAEAGLDPVTVPALPPGEEMLFGGATIRQLLAERQYWREHMACQIEVLLGALDQRAAPKGLLLDLIRNAHHGLKDAIEGRYFDICEGCGLQIWPGEIEIPCTDVRCHADCRGREGIKAGDQVKVPAGSIQVEEGQAPRDYVVAFEATNLFTDDEILERLERADRILAAAEPKPRGRKVRKRLAEAV